MGIKLSLKDQIKVLKSTIRNIDERIKYIIKVDFDECFLEYATESLKAGEAINEHRINLLLDPVDIELETLQREASSRIHFRTIPNEPIFDGRRIWE